MVCKQCQVHFFSEENGPRLWLTHIPKVLSSLTGRWMTFQEIRVEVEKVKKSLEVPVSNNAVSSEPLPPPPVVVHDTGATQPLDTGPETLPEVEPETPKVDLGPFIEQAKKLYSMGNTPHQIEQSFRAGRGISRAQVEQVMSVIYELEQKKHRSQNSKMAVVFVVVALIIVIFGCVGFVFYSLRNSVNPAQLAGVRQPTKGKVLDIQSLPGPLQTIVPPGVQVMAASTPYVVVGTTNPGEVVRASCPKDARGAAEMFGGDSTSWTYNGQTWVLASKKPVSLNLPAGLSLGYLETGGSVEVRTIYGPAVVHNMYVAFVNCQ
jgi:hypothetical protein